MARHSFIQMSKLSNVKGRISYISDPKRQEYLYATFSTREDMTFWNDLANECQEEFKRFGTEGKCIEARELIIALPEEYTQFDPNRVLREFTEQFKKRYDMECVSALHHNKTKKNYHIHLIFSERRLLSEPEVKIATRSVYYDELGKRVRTKKEITGEDGQIRVGCRIIKKGEAYESHLFTAKDDAFKNELFLDEAKQFYTALINRYVHDPERHLKVFDPNSVYLPTKKIGKNNPKAAEIEADVILLAKNIDGVYSADPHIDASAVKYDAITYDEVLAKHLAVMDLTATSLAMENDIPVVVFALADPQNIVRAVMGEPVGTVVTK